VNNSKTQVAKSLYETPTEEENTEYANLKSIDVDLEQANYI
jgi:hypothetical protein